MPHCMINENVYAHKLSVYMRVRYISGVFNISINTLALFLVE